MAGRFGDTGQIEICPVFVAAGYVQYVFCLGYGIEIQLIYIIALVDSIVCHGIKQPGKRITSLSKVISCSVSISPRKTILPDVFDI